MDDIDNRSPLAGFVPADPDLVVPVRRRATAFWGKPPEVLVAAPGRIEIVGNHVDYNGGEVVAAAIDRWVAVAARRRADREVRIAAPDAAREAVSIPIDEAYTFDRQNVEGQPHWSDYARATIAALHDHGISPGGVDLYYRGTVPQGFGLSSSSALLVALTAALVRVAGTEKGRLELARIAQAAEHRAGAPVGLLDQTASVVGGVLRFSNDPARVMMLHARLGDAGFAVVDSGVRHALPGSRYPVRVRECQEAVQRLQDTGFAITTLAELRADDLARAMAVLPPPLDARVRHVVEEVRRTALAEEAIEAGDQATLGRLMNESGQSSATHYDISHPAVEAIVDVARATPGVYGARMMGGGDGGAAIVFLEHDALPALEQRLPENAITLCRISRGLSFVN